MKTLVIHPKDNSTDFLSAIYEGMDCDIISECVSKRALKETIKNHDRIIMLGHGTQYGLIGYRNPQTRLFRSPYLIIDSNFVYLLREKECVCIWCNADIFVEKYNLKGFYTGMIISEVEEALDYCVTATKEEIEFSNKLLAESVKKAINSHFIVGIIKESYKSDTNQVIHFNQENLYFNK